MAKIFITGSADGLGQMAGKLLISHGHQVFLHARNAERARQLLKEVPTAEKILTADLSSVEETQQLAAEVNSMGHFDAIIHNAGVYQVSNKVIFSVNTLAPYILTCLIQMPSRLIYLSSGMHLQGDPRLKNFATGNISYSDSKLHVVLLSMVVAREWPQVFSNAVDPGWVATRMGGAGAPDNLQKGFETQAWLAVSDEDKAKVSGQYFHHKRTVHRHAQASDTVLQDHFIDLCEQVTGIRFPVPNGKGK